LTVNQSRTSKRVTTDKVCGNIGNFEDYLKINPTFNYNQTNVPLTFSISEQSNTKNDPWGVK